MDFEDTPEEAEFRAGARSFLDKNAKRREPGAGMVYRAGNEDPEFRAVGQGLAGQEGRRRLCRHHLAEGLGRARRHAPSSR